VRGAATGEGENFAVRKDRELNSLCDRVRRCAAMWVFPGVYKMYHPNADIDRIYMKRKEGRSLLPIEAKYKAELINISEYLNTK
jgi:hypothetical protein